MYESNESAKGCYESNETTALHHSLTSLTSDIHLANDILQEANEASLEAHTEVLRLEGIQAVLEGMLRGYEMPSFEVKPEVISEVISEVKPGDEALPSYCLKQIAMEFKDSLIGPKGLMHPKLVEVGFKPDPKAKVGTRTLLMSPTEVLKAHVLQEYPDDPELLPELLSSINEILCLISVDGTSNRATGKAGGRSIQGLHIEI